MRPAVGRPALQVPEHEGCALVTDAVCADPPVRHRGDVSLV